jgi:hypothetical protein
MFILHLPTIAIPLGDLNVVILSDECGDGVRLSVETEFVNRSKSLVKNFPSNSAPHSNTYGSVRNTWVAICRILANKPSFE